VGASYEWSIETIKQRLGANPIPMQCPIGNEDNFRGIVDLITRQAIYWQDVQGREMVIEAVPLDLVEKVEEMRAAMVEKIAENDDTLIVKYLDGDVISDDELKAALRRVVIHNMATPVFCGSAMRNKGVQPLLDAIIDYLPSPDDIPPVSGIDPDKGTTVQRMVDDNAAMSALVFKIVTDPYVGRLAYIRVYSGTLKQGGMALNSGKGKKERVGRLLRMYADRREDITEVYAGEIVAILGLKDSFTGDTLCDAQSPVVLENITFPEPVISVAIEPKTMADQDKMAEALRKLSEEDPTFRVRTDEQTGQTIMSGMGELQLDVLVDRMMREFRVHANIGKPRVAYRETISNPVNKVVYRYVKQTGGHGQYGHVVFNMRPLERGSGVQFVNKIVSGAIPTEYIPAIQRGVMEASESGVLAGYMVTDIEVTLVDGSFHEVDSSEMAFRMAAIFGFKEGLEKGSPILLEPLMKLEVLTPSEYVGDVIGLLSARRAEIQGLEPRHGNTQAVTARVPLAEMFGYATDLRSSTQGRGVFSMEFDHYSPVSESVAKKVLNK
jgi:elongation factor G